MGKVFQEKVQNEIQTSETKMKIPKNIQKQMLEFFMQTSIPRKKASFSLNENHLPTKESGR